MKRFIFLLLNCFLINFIHSDNIQIPLNILFEYPQKTSPKISPNGLHIAYLAPIDGILNIWLKSTDQDDDIPVTNSLKDIHSFCWSPNSEYIIYRLDQDGDEKWHLFRLDLKTRQTIDLAPHSTVASIIAMNPQSNEILIKDNKSLQQVDLKSGKMTFIANNPKNFVNWVADSQSKIRAMITSNEDGGLIFHFRNREEDPWKILCTLPFDDATTFSFNNGNLSFSSDNRFLYLIHSTDSNTTYLDKIEIATGKHETIYHNQYYDIKTVIFNNKGPQLVSFISDHHEWVSLDPSFKEDFQNILGLNSGNLIYYYQKGHFIIAGFESDVESPSYYLYNCETKKSSFLFYERPQLFQYKLAHTSAISIKSRDGLTLHGYLTLPNKKFQHLPTVLLVHGGPRSRDTWEFDPIVQWLANQGYACLKINYRGSIGYGKQLFLAGCREYAGKMHHDLVDTVDWAIKNKIADPKKIAIMGFSYGGYAALVGATFTPDLFCCAIDFAGFSDLYTHTKYWVQKGGVQELKWKGNPKTEEDFLKSRSPLFKVDRIKIPILIAQGANDPNVLKCQADIMVNAMKKLGFSYEYLLFADEGHYCFKFKTSNRLRFFKKADEFLANHLKQ